jgi:hypothetical protein
MSRTALRCAECGARLAWQRDGGRLVLLPGVVTGRPATGDRSLLKCPACGALASLAGVRPVLMPTRSPRSHQRAPRAPVATPSRCDTLIE